MSFKSVYETKLFPHFFIVLLISTAGVMTNDVYSFFISHSPVIALSIFWVVTSQVWLEIMAITRKSDILHGVKFTRLTKMHAKAPTCFNFFNFHPVSTKILIDIEHIILTNRMVFVFRIATFLAGKWRHKLGAKKLTVIYW